MGPEQRVEMVGPLVGTHAHEQSSMMQQLMAGVDKRAGACRRGEDGREGMVGVGQLCFEAQVFIVCACVRVHPYQTVLFACCVAQVVTQLAVHAVQVAHAMLCYAMLCYAMLCCVGLCLAVLCPQGGESDPPPLCVTSLLAHLLFIVASGDLRRATALADTFGSPAFIAVAAAADVPPGFVRAMKVGWLGCSFGAGKGAMELLSLCGVFERVAWVQGSGFRVSAWG